MAEEAKPRQQQPPAQAASSFQTPLLLSDADILALGVPTHDLELFRRRAYQQHFSVSTWINSLREHTFRTHILPVSFIEAKALVESFYVGLELRSQATAKRRAEEPSSRQGGIGIVSYETILEKLGDKNAEQRKVLEALARRLDTALEEFFGTSGAFVKLNTRSPKDVVVYDFEDETTSEAIRAQIATMPNDRLRARDENALTIAFVKATNRCMRMHTGQQIVRTLVLSSRVSEDLNKVIQFGKDLFDVLPCERNNEDSADGGGGGASIILREWRDEVIENPFGELRAFVHDNELHAMTQYFSFVKFEEYQDADFTARVEKAVRTFFVEHCKEALRSHQSYVIDFCVLLNQDKSSTDADEFEILVIELNPFHSGAGAGLFSWRENRTLFMNGPFEFRVVRDALGKDGEHRDSPLDVLPPFWQREIKRTVEELVGEPWPGNDDEVAQDRQPTAWSSIAWAVTTIAVPIAGLCIFAFLRRRQ